MEFFYRFLGSMDGLVVIRLIDVICRIDIVGGIGGVIRCMMNIMRITVHTTYDGRIVLDMNIAHSAYTYYILLPSKRGTTVRTLGGAGSNANDMTTLVALTFHQLWLMLWSRLCGLG